MNWASSTPAHDMPLAGPGTDCSQPFAPPNSFIQKPQQSHKPRGNYAGMKLHGYFVVALVLKHLISFTQTTKTINEWSELFHGREERGGTKGLAFDSHCAYKKSTRRGQSIEREAFEHISKICW